MNPDVVTWILLVSTGLYISLELLWSAILLLSGKKQPSDHPVSVSVLVAARNEAQQIQRLLESLDQLDYPRNRLEILIGEDRSEDQTAALVREFIRERPHFRMVSIQKDLPGLRGKQNVLAQLAQVATGELFLVTDADIVVSPEWVSGMVANFQPETGMVSSVTLAEPVGIFGGLQCVDWAVGMGVNGAMSALGLPVTAVGNNMAVRASMYRACGGYEAMLFSVTEDLLLFREMSVKRGYGFAWSMDYRTVNRTQPVKGLGTWLRQRKRWFSGGSALSWFGKLILGVYYLHIPVLMVGFAYLPWQNAALAWGFRICGDVVLLAAIGMRTRDLRPLAWVLPYQPWAVVQAILLPLNQLWPGGVVWKGRHM